MRRFKSAARQGGFVMIQHREKAGPDIDHQSVPNRLEGNYSGYLSGKKYVHYVIQDTLFGKNTLLT